MLLRKYKKIDIFVIAYHRIFQLSEKLCKKYIICQFIDIILEKKFVTEYVLSYYYSQVTCNKIIIVFFQEFYLNRLKF